MSIKEEKGLQVQKMFDGIATRYDLMNRVMTMGQDQRWRHFVVEKAAPESEGLVLDLASGTGDIASLLARKYPQVGVVGGDFSVKMLEEAGRRFGRQNIHWQVCDARRLPFRDNSLSAVTFGYLLRNVDDASEVLREVYRVLRPGGRVVCLDTTPPEKDFFYPFILAYFKVAIPILGKLLAQNDQAYAYLTGSTMDFYEATELARLFEYAGFCEVEYRKFMLKTIGVHWGRKN